MGITSSGTRLVVARVLSTIISYGGLAYFAGRFSGTVLGPFFLFQAILTVSGLLGDFGIRGAVEKRISGGEDAGRVLATALALKIPPIIVITSLMYVFRAQLNDYIGANAWLALCVGLFLHEGALLMFSVLRGELQVGETAALVILRNVTWVIVGVALAFRGWGAEGPIVGLLLGYVGVIGLGFVRTRTSPSVPDVSTAKSLVGYGKYEMFNNATWQVFSWTDVLVLGFFVGSTGVAAYEIAWRISRAAILASNTATIAVFPHASRAAADDNLEEIRTHAGSLLTVVALIVVPAFFGVAALGEEILSVAFSSDFVIATTALIILTGQSFIQAVQSVFGQLLLALDRPELPTKAASVALFSNILLNLTLIPLFGLTGAAVATGVAYLLNLMIQYRYITNLFEPQIPWREAAVSVVGSLLMYTVLEQVTIRYDISSYLELFSTIGLGIALFFAVSVTSEQTRLVMVRFVRKLL